MRSLIVKRIPIPGGYSCEGWYATPDVGASLWKAVDWEENRGGWNQKRSSRVLKSTYMRRITQ
jgi:hypothetical protein